jgi:hypothetical protein
MSYCDKGTVLIKESAVERALQGIVISRYNNLFDLTGRGHERSSPSSRSCISMETE